MFSSNIYSVLIVIKISSFVDKESVNLNPKNWTPPTVNFGLFQVPD